MSSFIFDTSSGVTTSWERTKKIVVTYRINAMRMCKDTQVDRHLSRRQKANPNHEGKSKNPANPIKVEIVYTRIYMRKPEIACTCYLLNEFVRIEFECRFLPRNEGVCKWLCELGHIELIVPKSAIANDIDENVVFKFLSEIQCQFASEGNGLWIFCVDMNNGRFDGFRDVSTIFTTS